MSIISNVYGELEEKSIHAMAILDAGQPTSAYKPKLKTELKPVEEVLQEEETKIKVKAYGFSRELAKTVGIIPALILKFIAYKVYSVRHLKDGKFWYYATYRDIAKQYPFMSPTTVYRAIKVLSSEKYQLLTIGKHNHRKSDETMWFSVTEENRNLAEGNLIYFDPSDAYLVGLKAAIVFYHLNYIFKHKAKLLKDGKWLKVWPSDLAAYQPLTKWEARNAVAQLVSIGFLVKDESDANSCLYRLATKEDNFGLCGIGADPQQNGADPHDKEADLQ